MKKADAKIIDDLGGPAKVAELLGYPSDIGTQRVHNWKVRGIPAKVRLAHLDLFRPADCTPTQQEAA